ncbi:hypothetical protein ABW20_dc0106902 [Dactylellina cionopaga]|nr:hypothetical protein ABW20_dc0106902 [Dactylellina cionopaga]
MGLGLGLLNYGGGESMGNRFWAPVLGGCGSGGSVDMIYAVGFERGCEKWGQRLVQRLTTGVGRCGPAHCVSLSYLLSLSLRQLNPSAPNYTSQVHAALSGKYLVPQLEDYLSVNTNTRCLVITFDAATVPNTNLEPLRELRRVLDGPRPDSSFKIISVIGGPVNGEEPTLPSRESQQSPNRGSYRTSPVPRKSSATQRSSRSDSSRALSPVERTSPLKKTKSNAAMRADEKTLMRRRELEALSNMLMIQKLDDGDVFEGYISRITEQVREREEKTGSYKAFESTFEEKMNFDEDEDTLPSNEYFSQPEEDEEEEEEEEEEEDDEFEVSYNNVMMTVEVPRQPQQQQQPQKARGSTWSKMWSREVRGKKKSKANGHNHYASQEQVQGSAKAFKLLGLDN